MQSDSSSAERKSAVKQLIDELEKEFGSLRKAAEEIGIKHQNLMNWRDGSNDKFIEILERIRLALKIPKAEFWSKIRQGKK